MICPQAAITHVKLKRRQAWALWKRKQKLLVDSICSQKGIKVEIMRSFKLLVQTILIDQKHSALLLD